jgi:CRP-like cAMP-binding protein
MSGQISLLPPVGALDSTTQAFPRLMPAQIERTRPYGKVRQVASGEIIFDVSDIGISMFIILSGKTEIVKPDGNGERRRHLGSTTLSTNRKFGS